MTVRSKAYTDFEDVCNIASRCTAIDPNWYPTLIKAGRSYEAVQECEEHLRKLAPPVSECCAIFFPAIGESSDPKNLVIQHRDFTNDEAIEDRFGPIEQTVKLSDFGTSKFYLTHATEIFHVRLTPYCRTVLELSSDPNPKLWKITSEQIKQMSKKIWNGSFIAATDAFANVIQIPSNQPQKQWPYNI